MTTVLVVTYKNQLCILSDWHWMDCTPNNIKHYIMSTQLHWVLDKHIAFQEAYCTDALLRTDLGVRFMNIDEEFDTGLTYIDDTSENAKNE